MIMNYFEITLENEVVNLTDTFLVYNKITQTMVRLQYLTRGSSGTGTKAIQKVIFKLKPALFSILIYDTTTYLKKVSSFADSHIWQIYNQTYIS